MAVPAPTLCQPLHQILVQNQANASHLVGSEKHLLETIIARRLAHILRCACNLIHMTLARNMSIHRCVYIYMRICIHCFQSKCVNLQVHQSMLAMVVAVLVHHIIVESRNQNTISLIWNLSASALDNRCM